jgi:hypothetical protein
MALHDVGPIWILSHFLHSHIMGYLYYPLERERAGKAGSIDHSEIVSLFN